MVKMIKRERRERKREERERRERKYTDKVRIVGGGVEEENEPRISPFESIFSEKMMKKGCKLMFKKSLRVVERSFSRF